MARATHGILIINTLSSINQWCHSKSLMFDPADKVWGQWCWYNRKPVGWDDANGWEDNDER